MIEFMENGEIGNGTNTTKRILKYSIIYCLYSVGPVQSTGLQYHEMASKMASSVLDEKSLLAV